MAPLLPDDLIRTRRALEDGRARGLHPGAQVAVSRGRGEARERRDLVVGERRPGEPMTPDTLVVWMSSGKPVTVLAIALLWERGLLDLDDPVARHVPEFGAAGKSAITLRHLLTHTGGIRTISTGWPEKSWDDIVASICARKSEPRWVPGQKAGYHAASSWFLLGEIVRRLSGRDFSAFLRDEVFLPLGMHDSWLGMPTADYRRLEDRLARIDDTSQSPPRPLPHHEKDRVTSTFPGGNAWGPMRDLARLYEMLLDRGRAAGRTFLRPQTVEALTARHRVGLLDHTFRQHLDWCLGLIPNSPAHRDEELPAYGYGRHASRRAVGHSGHRSSTAFVDPEHDLVVAVHTNGMARDDEHTRRFLAVTEAIYEDLGLAPRDADGSPKTAVRPAEATSEGTR